jgi:DNA repair protein RadC
MEIKAQITSPADAYQAVKRFAKKRQKHFLVLTLNAVYEVIRRYVMTVGLVNRTLVHPREVFFPAIRNNAVAIVAAHNHPSGNVTPSPEDNVTTGLLQRAGELLGIPVLDHIIIGKHGYYSFTNTGRRSAPFPGIDRRRKHYEQ